MKKDKFSVYFFAPIATEKFNSVANVTGHVAAASNKVMSMARAIKEAGGNSVIISSPIMTHIKKQIFIRRVIAREKNILTVFLKSISVRGFNRIYASLSYLFFGIKHIKLNDKVIFYNFFPEYLLLAIWLYFRKNKAILDIEDGLRHDERNLRGIVNWLSYSLLNLFVRKNKISSSIKLAEKYSENGFVCYGTFRDNYKGNAFLDDRIKVLYGGALQKSTGVDLFCDCLKTLAKTDYASAFEFIVTGFGDVDSIIDIKEKYNDILNINIYPDIAYTEYEKIMLSCDIGLSLKLASSTVGNTTFPSKTLELAGAGLLLVTTKVSDVPFVFSKSDCYFLEQETSESLVNLLIYLSKNRLQAQKVALNGRNLVKDKYSVNSVGHELMKFIDLVE